MEVSFKGELDLVTPADMESESTIVSLLTRRMPGVAILAEEGGETRGDADRRYIVDPLDGTTNFAHGYPHFAVSIAYEHNGRIVLGIVYDPLRGELFSAEEGQGAFLNGHRLRVSDSRVLEHALLVTGFPYDLKDDVAANLRLFNRFMAEARAIRRDGSAALNLCYVAAGRFDGYWEEKLASWDMAAGSLVVAEASGRVTDFQGGPFDCFGRSVLATNGVLHKPMLEVLREL
jgi:myo-inositol-1(or 4)-monophosphatase